MQHFPIPIMPGESPLPSRDSELTGGEDAPLKKGDEADQPTDLSQLGDFGIQLKVVIDGLQSGGPEVSIDYLVGYLDKTLAPSAMQQVGRNIVTWRAWYDEYWKLAGALDGSRKDARD